MEEEELRKGTSTQRVKQTISIPFLWELKPGIPKKDWKPESEPEAFQVNPIQTPPIKLVASIPFTWEEKPGKPLPCFSEEKHDRGVFELEFEAFEFESSFTSIPKQDTPSSPVSESDASSLSSYATGVTSLTGSSFLECLFPLFPPNSGFLEKAGFVEERKLAQPGLESNCSVVIRKPPTLGELIMMSRKMSCKGRAFQVRKEHHSTEFMMKKAFGCCMLGGSGNSIGRLQGKRNWQWTLKLE